MKKTKSITTIDCRINDRHVSYDDYMDRIRASANARKPLTSAEKKILGVYFGLVLLAVLIAAVTGH